MLFLKMANGTGRMKIKVAGRIYDSTNIPIMLIMSDKEKEDIQKLNGNIYTIITPRMTEEEIRIFNNE